MIPKLLKSVEFKGSKIHIPIEIPIDFPIDFPIDREIESGIRLEEWWGEKVDVEF